MDCRPGYSSARASSSPAARHKRRRSSTSINIFKRRKQGTSAEAPAKPTFFDLPGEIRNKVHRYVLVEHVHIRKGLNDMGYPYSDYRVLVAEGGHEQPGWLRTCKQVRAEASAIYYRENDFLLVSYNWDSTAALTFFQHASHHIGFDSPNIDWGTPEDRASIVVVSWFRLWTWLRRTHEGHLPFPGEYFFDPDEGQHVYNLFELIRALENSPWDSVSVAMDIYCEGTELSKNHRLPRLG